MKVRARQESHHLKLERHFNGTSYTYLQTTAIVLFFINAGMSSEYLSLSQGIKYFLDLSVDNGEEEIREMGEWSQ